MANNKNKGLGNVIVLSNGRIPIICSKCLGDNYNCEKCNGKKYTWEDVYNGKVDYKNKSLIIFYSYDGEIVVSDGKVAIKCFTCLAKSDDCNDCNTEKYSLEKIYTGEVKYLERFFHTIYIKQKQKNPIK